MKIKFYEFISALYKNSHMPNQGLYVLEIFSALCGEESPFLSNKEATFSPKLPKGLTGDDPSYRKRLFNGDHKKYRGLSNPIKVSIRGNEKKETFIAYLEKSVALESFPKLCAAFEVSDTVDRHIIFESLYEQFKKFTYSSTDDVACIVSDTVKGLLKGEKEANISPPGASKGTPVLRDSDNTTISTVDTMGSQVSVPEECRICHCCKYWKGDMQAAYHHVDGVYGICKRFSKNVLSIDGANCGDFKPNYGNAMEYIHRKKYKIPAF